MSTEIIFKIRDDIDGTDAAVQDFAFTYRGVEYKIDLSEAHLAKFDKAMAPFVAAARSETPAKAATPGTRAAARQKRAEIREWARRAGFEVKGRGAIAPAVFEAYAVAHPTENIADVLPIRKPA